MIYYVSALSKNVKFGVLAGKGDKASKKHLFKPQETPHKNNEKQIFHEEIQQQLCSTCRQPGGADMFTHLRRVDGHAAASEPGQRHGTEDSHPVTEEPNTSALKEEEEEGQTPSFFISFSPPAVSQ